MSGFTGFASVDGTDGFTRVGTPLEVKGIFRHRDDFGRLYFEITPDDHSKLVDAHVEEDDNVSWVYFDEYWKVHMIKGRFSKIVDVDPIVAKIDNRLVCLIKGQIYEMAAGSVIEDKPYKGTYLSLESVNVLSKQLKEVQKASADYLTLKAAREAAAVRDAAKGKVKSSSKKEKTSSKKKAHKKKKVKVVSKPKLVDDEADQDEDGEGEDMDEE